MEEIWKAGDIVENKSFNPVLRLKLLQNCQKWCKSCQNVKPQLEHLAKEYEGTVLVGTIDVDLNPETVSEYGIRNIPAILYFRNGELLDKHIGAGTFIDLRDKLEKLL